MQQSITFSGELDERAIDREVEALNSRLQEAGNIEVNAEGGFGDGLGGGIGGDGMAADELNEGIGGIQASLVDRMPASIGAAGGVAAKAMPVALAGGVGVGILSAMHSASASLQTSASVLGNSWNRLWRPMGDQLDQMLVRDAVMSVADATREFESSVRTEGIPFAAGELAVNLTGDTVTGLADAAGSSINDQLSRGALGQLQSLAGPLGEFGPGVIMGGVSGGTGMSRSKIRSALRDAIPTMGGIASATTLPVSLAGSAGLGILDRQERIEGELGSVQRIMSFARSRFWEPLSGGVSNILSFFSDPSELLDFDASGINDELEDIDLPDFPGWPDITSLWPGWPDVNVEWPGWPNLNYNIPEFPGWPEMTNAPIDVFRLISDTRRSFWGDFMTDTFSKSFWNDFMTGIYSKSFWNDFMTGVFSKHFWDDFMLGIFSKSFWDDFMIDIFSKSYWDDFMMDVFAKSLWSDFINWTTKDLFGDIINTGDDLLSTSTSSTPPKMDTGGRIVQTGVAEVHRGEMIADPDRLVNDLADAINQTGGGGGGSADVDTSTLESQLNNVERELRRLRSAMDVTVQVGREEIARASQQGQIEDVTDTDPTV